MLSLQYSTVPLPIGQFRLNSENVWVETTVVTYDSLKSGLVFITLVLNEANTEP